MRLEVPDFLHRFVSGCIIEPVEIEPIEETADDVVAAARAQGHPVTRTQLARWHRLGLLPRPRRQSLGRGHGMMSLYPAGTTTQLLRLRELQSRERQMTLIAFELWWEGYSVPEEAARHLLADIGRQFDDEIHRLRDMGPGEVRAEAEQTATSRTSTKMVRRMRKRVGAANFPKLVLALVSTLEGQSALFDPEGNHGWDAIVEVAASGLNKGLGLQRAHTDQVRGIPAWLPPDSTQSALKRVPELLRGIEFEHIAREAPAAYLIAARDGVKAFAAYFIPSAELVTARFGKDMFGMSAFAELLSDLGPEDRAAVLLGVLLFLQSNDDFTEGIRTFTEMAEQVDRLVKAQRLLARLQAEIPALAKPLSRRRQKAALRSPAAAARQQNDWNQAVEAHRSEIDIVVASDQELARLWREVGAYQVAVPTGDRAASGSSDGEGR
jgi:hypothetical protein